MELRVWVDGTQRVVCGVKLTTTCQEIVFALAHATQQAGRFTMIERWQNNERLLSPSEQPLVSLQRWGDRMHEVEFFLRKTSNDMQPIPAQSTHQPQQPTVPAKPRVNQVAPVANINSPPTQSLAPVNAQMNYQMQNFSPYNNMYPGTVRPRQPPGYMDYMQTVTRNSLPQTMSSNPSFVQGNTYIRPYETNSLYDSQTNGVSPVNNYNERYRFSMNGPVTSTTYERDPKSEPIDTWNLNSIRPMNVHIDKTTMVNNRNSLGNHISRIDENITTNSKSEETEADTSSRSITTDANNLVSKMGHDMLKVIEEQKKVLLNQKSTLDKLDQEQEYWKSKQNTEQIELINRIENEIHQLEDLWKENQSQIKKLENQNLEKELDDLKSEQQNLESEVIKQKNKLAKFENDIALCKVKMDQLEKEVSTHIPPKNRKQFKEIKDVDIGIKVD